MRVTTQFIILSSILIVSNVYSIDQMSRGLLRYNQANNNSRYLKSENEISDFQKLTEVGKQRQAGTVFFNDFDVLLYAYALVR
jgi:hypothetical protein